MGSDKIRAGVPKGAFGNGTIKPSDKVNRLRVYSEEVDRIL